MSFPALSIAIISLVLAETASADHIIVPHPASYETLVVPIDAKPEDYEAVLLPISVTGRPRTVRRAMGNGTRSPVQR